MKAYDVTVTPKHLPAGWINSDVIRVFAKDGGAAIKQARQVMRFQAGWTRQDGPVDYRAKRATDI